MVIFYWLAVAISPSGDTEEASRYPMYFSPSGTRQAFLDFADFLVALVANPQLKIPNPARVANFVERVHNAARSGQTAVRTGRCILS